jgi:hypothetical protein
VALRQALDLYALVRPVKAYKGARNLRDDLDFVIVRENTEDIYAGIEFELRTPDCDHLISEISTLAKKPIKPDSGLSIKYLSVSGSERIVQFAFDYAKERSPEGDRRAQGNIMKHTDGLFAVARQVASGTPTSSSRTGSDNMHALVLRLKEYDVPAPEPLRGHHLRPRRRDDRRPGVGARRKHRDQRGGVRGDAWQRAQVQGPQQGQPDGGDAFRGLDASPPWRGGRRRRARGGDRRSNRRGQERHIRPEGAAR